MSVGLDRGLGGCGTGRVIELLPERARYRGVPVGDEEDRALSWRDRAFERLEVGAVRLGAEERTRDVELLTSELQRHRGRLVRRIHDERREARGERVGGQRLREVEVAAVRASIGLRGSAWLLTLGRAAGEIVGALLDHAARARIDDRPAVERALEETGLCVRSPRLRRRLEGTVVLDEAAAIVAAGSDQRDDGRGRGHGAERAKGGTRAPHGSFTSTGWSAVPFGSPAPS